jgi:Fe-S-cluster-containing dehydrogenase component/formate-dependent nitrite reductase membrane component NrfD
VNYAFLIDNRRCIGCHACSVACKAEHEVPVGVARTWVKYIEKGEFPQTRRTFTVTRCNHCEDAPCVEICPTTALFKRRDGIVDFDSRRCIGCKACMQGCPYDALYIDPQTETAAKCNFCAHRVEVGLEPPCVTVCPTQAIVAGDLEDKTSRIAHLVGRVPLQVRKPEKGTRPKVFYVEADAAALVPSAAPPASDYMWAQAPQAAALPAMPLTEDAGAPRRTYGIREQHRNSWGWKVSAYLWTKSIAAGVYLVPALLSLLYPESYVLRPGVCIVALFFLGVTGLLLVWDLRQPQRFLWTLTRPQWRSWLVRGAYVITAYGLLLSLEIALAFLGRAPGTALNLFTLLAAAGTAVYTAFLFGQSKGRDYWQSSLLAPHLIVQALCAGAALFAPDWLRLLLPLNGLVIATEVWGRHPTEDGRRAAHLIENDLRFTAGVLLIGHVVPLLVLWFTPRLDAVAGSLTLAGLLIWEHLYVQAPQRIPNA